MKPVHPDESKYSRALFAARLHVKSGTELSAAAVREVCDELLRLSAPALRHARLSMEDAYHAMAVQPLPPFIDRDKLVAIAAQRLPHDVIQAQLKQTIDAGEKRCPHGVAWEWRQQCSQCAGMVPEGG